MRRKEALHKQTPAFGRARTWIRRLACGLRERRLAGDTGNVEPDNAEIGQLTIGKLRQLLDGFAVSLVGADLRLV